MYFTAITNLPVISSINAKEKKKHFSPVFSWNFLKDYLRVYLDGIKYQNWMLEKSSKYLVTLVELQLALLKLSVTKNWSLHGLSLSLKSKLGVHHGVSPKSHAKSWDIKITILCSTFEYVELHLASRYSPEHIQLIYNEPSYWSLTFCSNRRIQICDAKVCLRFVQKLCWRIPC